MPELQPPPRTPAPFGVPLPEPQPPPTAPRQVGAGERTVGLGITVLSLGTAVLLYWYQRPPAALLAFLLALGGATVTFQLLGDMGLGADTNRFVAGKGIRLGGSAAALVGIFIVLDQRLSTEMADQVDLAGSWDWQYAQEGWQSQLILGETEDVNTYSLSGVVRAGSKQLFSIASGTVKRHAGDRLELDATVIDTHGPTPRQVRWATASGAGLKRSVCFGGSFQVYSSKDGPPDGASWGIALSRWSP